MEECTPYATRGRGVLDWGVEAAKMWSAAQNAVTAVRG